MFGQAHNEKTNLNLTKFYIGVNGFALRVLNDLLKRFHSNKFCIRKTIIMCKFIREMVYITKSQHNFYNNILFISGWTTNVNLQECGWKTNCKQNDKSIYVDFLNHKHMYWKNRNVSFEIRILS